MTILENLTSTFKVLKTKSGWVGVIALVTAFAKLDFNSISSLDLKSITESGAQPAFIALAFLGLAIITLRHSNLKQDEKLDQLITKKSSKKK